MLINCKKRWRNEGKNKFTSKDNGLILLKLGHISHSDSAQKFHNIFTEIPQSSIKIIINLT